MSAGAAVPDPELGAGYEALRHGCGAYRLERDVLRLSGPESVAYLQGQCSQDVAGLAVGGSTDALLLEPDGKLSALVRVVRTADDGYLVDVDAGYGDAVAARLARFKLRSKVDIELLDWPCVALRGPGAPAAGPSGGTGASGGRSSAPDVQRTGVYVLAVRWNGTEGVDLLGPEAETAVPPGARWCGKEAWEAMRVEAGIPVMGRELDGRTIAAEAGLVERTVDFQKGCYTGQELIARLDARGNRVARRLCGVVLGAGAGSAAEADVAAAKEMDNLVGSELVVRGGDKTVGAITSAAWCPGVGGPAALAYLHRSVEVPGTVQVLVACEPGGAGVVPVDSQVRPLPLVSP